MLHINYEKSSTSRDGDGANYYYEREKDEGFEGTWKKTKESHEGCLSFIMRRESN